MQSQHIPREQWSEFIKCFSNEHQGWCATVELLDSVNGPQKLAEDLPLGGLSFDTKGSRACSLEITVGDSPRASVHHVIDNPRAIDEFDRDASNIDLQIEPPSGPKVLLHLHRTGGPPHLH